MAALLDLTGQTFGRLLVRHRVANHGRFVAWLCECTCGALLEVTTPSLRSGNTKSCGCWKKERVTANLVPRFKHGFARRGGEHPLYSTWEQMRERCNNPRNDGYHRYGGRGIYIDARWENFANFLADMGEKPGPEYSIDRIDNDGPYSPDNCRWATPAEQARNRG